MKILITGGSLGIGLATAKELHAAGNELLLVARNAQTLQRAQETLGSGVSAFTADLALPSDIQALLTYAEQIKFSPDVLVLDAAAFGTPGRSVVSPTVEEFQHLLDVNVLANFQLVQGFLSKLKKSRYPRVIIIGSTACIRPDDRTLYGVSKTALRAYALSLRSELREVNVGVTLINPGGTFTERRTPNEQVPPGRLLEASDIGKLIVTILSLSPQAVVEEVNIRPMQGDTY